MESYSVVQVAEKLKMSPVTVRKWARDGILVGATKKFIGDEWSIWMIPQSALDNLDRPERGRPRGPLDGRDRILRLRVNDVMYPGRHRDTPKGRANIIKRYKEIMGTGISKHNIFVVFPDKTSQKAYLVSREWKIK